MRKSVLCYNKLCSILLPWFTQKQLEEREWMNSPDEMHVHFMIAVAATKLADCYTRSQNVEEVEAYCDRALLYARRTERTDLWMLVQTLTAKGDN